MLDPYSVLGVSRDASMDEIKKAYRSLSRKYHPDANVNNPNKDQAEEKFKQIQQAYDQIVKERERGTSSDSWAGGYDTYGRGAYGGYGGGYGGYGAYQSQANERPIEMQAAMNYINAQHYREAMNVLESMSERNGEWYYLHAIANAGLGNSASALEDARYALQLEPNNMQFQRLYQQLQSGGQWYQSTGTQYGYPRHSVDLGNCCWQCMCLNCLCPGSCCCLPC